MSYPFMDLEVATGLSLTHMAEHLGVERTSLYGYRRKGLSFDKADEFAVRFGFVPENIWPAWREEANERAGKLEDEDRAKAVRRLESVRAAGRRHKARLRLDPAYRERQNAYGRAYRATYREGLNAARRRYYQQHAEREKAAATEYKRRKRAS